MPKIVFEVKMFNEARRQSKPHSPIIELLIFFLIQLIISVVTSIVVSPALIYLLLSDDKIASILGADITYAEFESRMGEIFNRTLEIMSNTPNWLFVFMLFSTAVMLIASVIYCRLIERRSLASMGFRRRGFACEYLGGLCVGTLLFGAVTALGVALGAVRFEGFNSVNIPLILLFFAGYMVQGMAEETLIHGYFMVSVGRKTSIFYTLILSSAMFSALHAGNLGVGFLSYFNLFIFGLFAGIYFIKRGNIWGVSGIHTAWNFVQGAVFGFSVSGTGRTASIFSFSQAKGYEALCGGQFGPEGGLIVTLVLFLALGAVYIAKPNANEVVYIEQNQDDTEEK